MNIFLIGFSMTGKSQVARRVAQCLGWEYMDTDDEVEKEVGKPIPEIFAQDGEPYFREMESRVLSRVCQRERVVVATGGGIVLNPQNRELMSQKGMVVLLEAEPKTIYERLSRGKIIRPLLLSPNPLQRIKELKSFRQPYYEFAPLTVGTDNLNLEQVTEEIVKRWHYWDLPPKVKVHTPTQSYPFFISWGCLPGLGTLLRKEGLRGKAVIISDHIVFPLYGQRVKEYLKEDGFNVLPLSFPAGEGSKNLNTAMSIYDFLIENRVERGDIIIALGGGVVGDLAGFIAATFLRGLPLVQVPTTLLAMVDASIGGKVAVNHPQGKNLIGAFYQPQFVLADIQTLTTLHHRELNAGWAEVIKHGFTLDPQLLDTIERKGAKLKALEPQITVEVIAHSARLKADVVSQDERERGKRIVLNYGHTIAHGLEAATNYERFLHGEAVAIGMMGEAKLSQRLGLLNGEVVERQKRLLESFGLPTRCSGIDIGAVLQAMELDKKSREGQLRWVLLKGAGEVTIRAQVPDEEVIAVLEELVTGFKSKP